MGNGPHAPFPAGDRDSLPFPATVTVCCVPQEHWDGECKSQSPAKRLPQKPKQEVKKEVKYDNESGDKNEGLKDFAQTELAPHMESLL